MCGWLTAPLAQHPFLNVRTYVKHQGRGGVFFLTEWIPNRLAALLAPRAYGLPYQLAALRYVDDASHGHYLRTVRSRQRELVIEATDAGGALAPSAAGSFEAFVMERYCAFTRRGSVVQRFEVAHAPWPQRTVRANIIRSDLLQTLGEWTGEANVTAAHYSPGVRDVAIGWPLVVGAKASASSDQ